MQISKSEQDLLRCTGYWKVYLQLYWLNYCQTTVSAVLENTLLRISVLCPLKTLWLDICSADEEGSCILDFKLSPCFESCMYSFGYFPGVWLLYADISEHSICTIFISWIWSILHIQPMKMKEIECSETSAYKNQTPGKYPKEYIQDTSCSDREDIRVKWGGAPLILYLGYI